MTIPKNISDATLLAKASIAKREANEAKKAYDAYAALIVSRGISGETDISTVTLTKEYERVDLDQTAVKSDNPDWQDKWGKVVHIGHSVRITFK